MEAVLCIVDACLFVVCVELMQHCCELALSIQQQEQQLQRQQQHCDDPTVARYLLHPSLLSFLFTTLYIYNSLSFSLRA